VVGTRQIERAAAQGLLRLVYLAADAEARVKRKVLSACEAAGVPVEEVPTMKELGSACRIAVGSAAAGILTE
jgi:large subunit ribosomal protein L7A